MITLIRFNSDGQEFALNCELIETIDQTPDTLITLTSGKKILVDESMDEIVRKVMEYRRTIYGSRGLR